MTSFLVGWRRREVNRVRARRALAILLVALWAVLGAPGEAWAGADAHGAVPLADDGDPADPILSSRAQRQAPGVWSVGGPFEFARAPLYRVVQHADGSETTVLLGDFFAWNLGATYGVGERIGIGITLPVFFASAADDYVDGPGFGDLHLAVPIGLVLPEGDGAGFGLAVTPVLRVPTGTEGRFLGDPAFGGALRLVAGYGVGRLRVSADAGLDLHGYDEVDTLRGGLHGSFAVASSFRATEAMAVHLEARGATPLNEGGDVPVEGLIGARGRVPSGLWWSAGVVRGFTSGVSASELRVFAGIGYTRPMRDADAVPEAPWQFRFQVVDVDGSPIPEAVVRVGRREVGRTDSAGELALEKVRWRDGVVVKRAGFLQATVERPEGDVARVVLDFTPVPVRFRIQDQEGSPVAADLAFTGPSRRPPTKAGPFGVADVELPPGDWYIEVVAPGSSRQARDVRVLRGSRP
ncbi:MAG: hypothetical protein JRJ84_16975, partial [Deltaproteobacteria bacterium]|nr:hypothetical protein [Deltaproteobacteria bacterium]